MKAAPQKGQVKHGGKKNNDCSWFFSIKKKLEKKRNKLEIILLLEKLAIHQSTRDKLRRKVVAGCMQINLIIYILCLEL